VAKLYELRGAIEGLAARLAAAAQPDLTALQATVDAMRKSAIAGSFDGLLDSDLRFHLELCKISGNTYLLEHARRILLPFFAFVRMRVAASGQETSAWDKDLEAHQRIILLLREGEGEVAELYVKKAMARFSKTAYDNWRSVSHMARDMARQSHYTGRGWGGHWPGGRGCVSSPAILLCIVGNCTSVSEKTEPEWTSSMAST